MLLEEWRRRLASQRLARTATSRTQTAMKHLNNLLFWRYYSSCAACTAAKPWVHTANDAAQALCAIYQRQDGTAPDTSAVVEIVRRLPNYAPFIATITAKTARSPSGVPFKTAALPDSAHNLQTPDHCR